MSWSHRCHSLIKGAFLMLYVPPNGMAHLPPGRGRFLAHGSTKISKARCKPWGVRRTKRDMGAHHPGALPALVFFRGSGTRYWADNSELHRLSSLGGNETMCTVDSSNNPALSIAEICLLKVLCIFVIN